MTDTLLSPLELADQRVGIVSDRQLVCVQTLYLSRLTSHPVVLVPGTFVAVTGRGPKGDSNGSGKTSFLASVSLLLGDPEWRLAGGAKAPTALLFDVRASGGIPTGGEHYESAGHGYVIGVFAHPDRPFASALTVWCRIDTTSPYLKIRWVDGVQLVDEGTDSDAHAAADARWAALPGDDLGFNSYAHRLYGESPRCLAYVQQRGERRNPPSLLQMHAGEFTPDQIGDSLIRLTGQRHLLDDELEQRKRLAAAEEALAEREREDREALMAEERQLADVRARGEAREWWGRAQHHWRLHFARGYLDVLEVQRSIEAQLVAARGEAETAELRVSATNDALAALASTDDLRETVQAAADAFERARARHDETRDVLRDHRNEIRSLTDRRNELQARAVGSSGLTVDEAMAEAAAVFRRRDRTVQRQAVADQAVKSARAAVAAVEGGGAGLVGRVLGALHAEGIPGRGLADAVVVAESGRSFWEPALSVWSEAVVVQAVDVVRALDVLSTIAGATLVAGDSTDDSPPSGIAEAPAGSLRFLRALAARHQSADDPVRVLDDQLGVHVVGGFPEPILGREARLSMARRALATAEVELRAADGARAQVDNELRVAEDEVEHAQAVAALPEVVAELERLAQAVVGASETVEIRARELGQAEQAHIGAQVAWQHHETLMDAARAEAERAHDALVAAVSRVRALEADGSRLAVDYWRKGWDGSSEAAETALADEQRGEPRLRKEASEALRNALWELGMKDDESSAPTPELATVVRRRRGLDDDGESGAARASLDEVGAPLADYLDKWADQDRLTEATIVADQERRARELDAARGAREEVRAGLAQVQDAVETIIESSLESISGELDRLRRAEGGHGADLLVEAIRPDGATGLWQWRVTPRWRRIPGGPMLRYDTRANTAQEKLFTVQLVLAALLSAPNPRGRVLILDELGDSLGDEHRKAVLRAIGETAVSTGITVLGTCQDSVLGDAARACGEILFFEHTADTDVLNRPTRVFGHDENGERVELTAEAATWNRPPV